MDRRTFWRALRDQVSSSFLLGGFGGAVVGGGAVAVYDRKDGAELSYAQQGEDLIVQGILGVLGIAKPTYLDVGAYDPTFHSNTFRLYRAGGHGVLVEPNPAKIRRLKRVRPRDLTLNIGIGFARERTTSDYYVIGGPSDGLYNTFSKKEAETLQTGSGGVHFIEKVLQMPLENINTIMQRHLGGAPNFLSIDTEGLDLDILRTLDFDRYRPDVICVETGELGTDRVNLDILALLGGKGYSVRGATYVNTIFIDDRHLSQPGPLAAPPRPKA